MCLEASRSVIFSPVERGCALDSAQRPLRRGAHHVVGLARAQIIRPDVRSAFHHSGLRTQREAACVHATQPALRLCRASHSAPHFAQASARCPCVSCTWVPIPTSSLGGSPLRTLPCWDRKPCPTNRRVLRPGCGPAWARLSPRASLPAATSRTLRACRPSSGATANEEAGGCHRSSSARSGGSANGGGWRGGAAAGAANAQPRAPPSAAPSPEP